MSNSTPQNNTPSSTDSALPVLALVLAFVMPIAGAIIGHIALGKINRGEIAASNRSLAKTGLIVGWVFTGLTAIFIPLYILVIIWLAAEGYDVSGY